MISYKRPKGYETYPRWLRNLYMERLLMINRLCGLYGALRGKSKEPLNNSIKEKK